MFAININEIQVNTYLAVEDKKGMVHLKKVMTSSGGMRHSKYKLNVDQLAISSAFTSYRVI